jgi:protein-tyrosine phosphatase
MWKWRKKAGKEKTGERLQERRTSRVLFVCTGNICRSPTAEGVLRHLAARMQVTVHVESAGTHDYHAGEPPDRRAQHFAKSRGYDLSPQRARMLRPSDFHEFDMIVAMDRGHLRILRERCPPEHHGKLRMLVNGHDVPDPYYGGPEGFERVLDMVEAACLGLLHEIKTTS